jgi:hypothetical protein
MVSVQTHLRWRLEKENDKILHNIVFHLIKTYQTAHNLCII